MSADISRKVIRLYRFIHPKKRGQTSYDGNRYMFWAYRYFSAEAFRPFHNVCGKSAQHDATVTRFSIMWRITTEFKICARHWVDLFTWWLCTSMVVLLRHCDVSSPVWPSVFYLCGSAGWKIVLLNKGFAASFTTILKVLTGMVILRLRNLWVLFATALFHSVYFWKRLCNRNKSW